ncbi:MAG: glutamate-5-semialdehyde dehydrogenase [Saprospiraceae bacterium]|nr:glutamate-5-semialdehyde dehydrogenase [Saprospiraceae bacterium]MCB9318096.1 glutamate-5-semialdehyde dehydrogenase [Lewinellaceae bacterium]
MHQQSESGHLILRQEIQDALEKVKQAARSRIHLSEEQVQAVLMDLADQTELNIPRLLENNAKDLERMDPDDPKYDRLLLNPERIRNIARDIRNVAQLPTPLGRILEARKLPNGLEVQKISVPIGLLGIVFESRPNVTFDVFTLCFKSGNACVLKGSRDAHDSNTFIVTLIRQVLAAHGIHPDLVYLAPSEREALQPILEADDYLDAIIPRGSQGLIDYVRQKSRVPVIETGAGIVHVYVDRTADLEKAQAIIRNSKTRRVSVCNALDCVLLHRDWLDDLPEILKGLDIDFNLEIFADPLAYQALVGDYNPSLLHHADPEHFGIEFLSMRMAVKTVDSMEEALDHIHRYSSKHSETIVAENAETIERFLTSVDAAVVYANASTAFTDGAEFGMGAEIGISTQKLHARGPMALPELTSYKWVVRGNGQIRP